MDNTSQNFCVCVLAHNEEKNIEKTIKALLHSKLNHFSIFIYANGCTDKTVQVCQSLEMINSRIKTIVIEKPSKINAWNQAFRDTQNFDYVVFSDGDVLAEKNAVDSLIADLVQNPNLVICSSLQLPLYSKEIRFEQNFIGFMQLPLLQEFIGGGLYAIQQKALQKIMSAKGFNGIPTGVTGEDGFLEFILNDDQYTVSKASSRYIPPQLKDYFKYLARIKWQNEQLKMILGVQAVAQTKSHTHFFAKLLRKIKQSNDYSYLFISIPATIVRYLFKIIFYFKIKSTLQSLGPIQIDGSQILQNLTRANSTK